MSIRAIFYDLDGTLRLNVPNSWRAFADFAAELGLISSLEDRLQMARWEHAYFADSPEIRADQIAFPDQADFWVNFSQRELLILGASPEQAAALAPKLCQRMTDDYRPVDLIPEDLLETLGRLKESGYLLGVLSNRDRSYTDYLSARGLGEFFELAVYAGETGMYKPNPGVFHYLLKKAGVSAQESIYVGDNYYADVVGARQAGLEPVLLDVNGLFAEPDCLVIQAHSQLFALLERRRQVWPGKEN
jgi:HAD superfamily hydrolase (TIGR01549 family)